MVEESNYFENADVYVTSSRLVIGTSIYYLNTITSIRERTGHTTNTYVNKGRRRIANYVGLVAASLLAMVGLAFYWEVDVELLTIYGERLSTDLRTLQDFFS